MVEKQYGIFDHIPIGVFVLKNDFVILFWNKCLEDWTGIPRSEIVGTNLFEHFQHLNQPKYSGRISDIFKGGPPTIFSSQLHKYIIPSTLPDGRRQIQHTTVISLPASNGNGFHALFAIQDVTELTQRTQDYRAMRDQAMEEIENRKKAQAKLQEAYEQAEMWVVERTFELAESNKSLRYEMEERNLAEEKLRSAHAENEQLLSAISSILIGIDKEKRIIKWNKAAEETFGISASAVMGKKFSKCGIQWEWEPIIENKRECLSKNKTLQLENFRFTRPDGEEGFLSITFNPITGENNEQLGLLILGSDITERIVLESQLANAQKLESVGLLAAGIAHEINTPSQYVGDNTRFLQESFQNIIEVLQKYGQLLTAIKEEKLDPRLVAEIESIIEEADIEYLSAEIPQAIEQSLEGVEQVSKIARAMKDFSHPGAEEEKAAVDINKAIESTITIARNEWKYMADMETELDPNLPLVSCVQGQFNQVILNMIVNASHAIADAIGENSGEKGKITIGTRRDGDWAEIRISDTGSGIPEEVREKIFNQFFTTKKVGKGTGQGLTISRNIVVEKHGGTIDFESETGKGTTFIVRLPVMLNSEAESEVPS